MGDADKSREELIDEVARLREELRQLRSSGAVSVGENRLGRYQEVLLRLALRPELVEADLAAALETITEASGDCLQVERTSVWRYVDGLSGIRCIDLFERGARVHSHGLELRAKEFPEYFAALAKERTIAAHEAHNDPRTRAFSGSYLTPLGISSLLDSPIRVGGRMLGVVCHEQVGPARVWTPEEQSFAGSIADLVSLAFAWDQRRRLEFKVQHAQKLESLGVLAGGIAHDFNNLLVGILGNADLAQREAQPGSRLGECLDDVETAAKRAADLCHQLLAYSGRGQFVIEPIDVNALVREMGHLLEVPFSVGAGVEYDLEEELPAVEADITQMRQVIMNLITNAAEAVAENSGSVTVRTGLIGCDRDYLDGCHLGEHLPPGDYVFVEVTDTGCGMSHTAVDKIFDPFFTSKRGGRGLGLAAVEGIVRGHRGAIRLATEAGVGTRFKVLFRGAEVAAPAAQPVALRGEGQWQGSGTVLLADDDKTVLSVGQRMLERMGFEVQTAADGRDAVAAFERDPASFTCVVLDLVMPQMSGQEAFRKVRSIRGDVPVVLCSGFAEQEALSGFAEEEMPGFLKKPYKLAELRETLRQAVDRRRRA